MPDISQEKTIPDLMSKEKYPLPCPSHIGPYKIESIFNKGGMSILYLATHPEIEKPLIIKVLAPKYAQNKEIVDRFLKEAKIIGMTNHPNIIKLFDQGKWEKGLYICMEFIQGISLKQFILNKSLSRRRALSIVLQVAYALCHLHTHGVIHRDLKPENILITESGDIKVIDFGISRLKEEVPNADFKRKTIGTPVYMSPEQKENPSNVNYNSDIFSLGIITYELLMGRLSHGIIQPSLLPKHLKIIIEKAIEKDPKKRYEDIVDFITDISEYLKTHEEEQEEAQQADEIMDSLFAIQKTLFSLTPPSWKYTEIGIATSEQNFISGQYLEFFKTHDNRYIVILIQPLIQGISSLARTSSLRGMIKMLINTQVKNKIDPIEIIDSLNQLITDDPFHQPSALSFLILDPYTEEFTAITCGDHSIFHATYVNEKINNVSSKNDLLGKDKNSSFQKVTSNWQIQDNLFILTFNNNTINNPEMIMNTISENLIYPAKMQANKILNQMIKNFSEKQKTLPSVITIKRMA